MWGFLVLISGGFFYTVGAIMNAKATPNPTVVRYQTQAESMFVWHNIAKKESQKTPGLTSFYYTSFSSYGFTDPTWETSKVSTNPTCLLTYKRKGMPLSGPQYVTASLAKYVSPGLRFVGFIDANGTVTASSNPSDIGKNFSVANAQDTPYIHECL